MLNVIKSIVVTMLSLAAALVSFARGPILAGLVVGVSIMSFAKKAEAALPPVMEDCGVALSCTYPSAVSLWEAMSFSQNMAVILWVIGMVIVAILIIKDKKARAVRKSAFQVELDAAIKAYNNNR